MFMLLKILGKNSFYLWCNSSSYKCTVISLFYLTILFDLFLSPNLEVHRRHGIGVMDIVELIKIVKLDANELFIEIINRNGGSWYSLFLSNDQLIFISSGILIKSRHLEVYLV